MRAIRHKASIMLLMLIALLSAGCSRSTTISESEIEEIHNTQEIVVFISYSNGTLYVEQENTKKLKEIIINKATHEDTMTFFAPGDMILIETNPNNELTKLLIINKAPVVEIIEEIYEVLESENLLNFEESSRLSLYVNGNQIFFDVEPQMEGGTIFIPLRYTLEAMGFIVRWQELTRSVDLLKDDIFVRIDLGRNSYRFNEQEPIKLSRAPFAHSGRTLVPIDFFTVFLAEKLNKKNP